MLRTCSKVLVLSNVPSFISYVSNIAYDLDVVTESSDTWNINYRLDADIIICGSKYLLSINELYYSKVRLVLKTNETVSSFIEMGITHFIFDYNNVREVSFSFYTEDEVKTNDEMNVTDIINKTKMYHYAKGKYDFNFETGAFKYDGMGIYLRECEKLYLAKWLLLGIKDNKKRIFLCKMRKKFGKNFLSDVDRYGKIKEENK